MKRDSLRDFFWAERGYSPIHVGVFAVLFVVVGAIAMADGQVWGGMVICVVGLVCGYLTVLQQRRVTRNRGHDQT